MSTHTNNEYHITRISAKDTLPVRHSVMWPDKPLDFVRLPDDDKGQHYSRFELGVKGEPFEKDGKTYVVMSKKISLYNNE